MADKTYTSDDIEVLTDAEHCRRRTNIYLGNMNVTSYDIPVLSANTLTIQSHSFIPAVYKAVGEIIDNATDEFSQITTKNKTLTITAEPLLVSIQYQITVEVYQWISTLPASTHPR